MTILEKNIMKLFLKASRLAILAAGCGALMSASKCSQDTTFTLDELWARDPFILADRNSRTYVLYVSAGKFEEGGDQPCGIDAYTSRDLVHWKGPRRVLTVPDDSWATTNLAMWAPEVHSYNGKYYAFGTLCNEQELLSDEMPQGIPQVKRGTQIFVSDDKYGPFEPLSDSPATPDGWMCLDGTLWVEGGVPYMVFCHEWAQLGDGTVDCVRMSGDLSAAVGEPATLFAGSAPQWAVAVDGRESYVTDGCFLYRTRTGRLLMIWSGFCKTGYCIGTASSESGTVAGPWVQNGELLVSDNGGHGMLFRDFDGKLRLVFHRPNTGGDPHPQIVELEDTGDTLIIKE